MNKVTFITVLTLLLAVGCGQKKAEQFKALPFPDIALPGIIQNQQDAADYYALHMWDKLADPERTYPSDSLLVSGVKKEDVEQRYANWLAILDMVSLKTSEKALDRLYERALSCERKDSASNVFETFIKLAEKYLYDPNSPLRNEEHYLHYAENLASYEGHDQVVRDRYARQAADCSLNRIGAKAADFSFADSRGRVTSLYEIKAPYTLLFFSNPGCEACLSIIEMLKGEQKVADMVSSGFLAVVNVYIDEDIQAWMEYMPIYPTDWHNGFDQDQAVRIEGLYSVRAIPSLYLLDNEKRVILKDAPENKMMNHLMNL